MLPLTNTSNIVIDLFIIIISIISSLNSGYEIGINNITLIVNLLFTLNQLFLHTLLIIAIHCESILELSILLHTDSLDCS